MYYTFSTTYLFLGLYARNRETPVFPVIPVMKPSVLTLSFFTISNSFPRPALGHLFPAALQRGEAGFDLLVEVGLRHRLQSGVMAELPVSHKQIVAHRFRAPGKLAVFLNEGEDAVAFHLVALQLRPGRFGFGEEIAVRDQPLQTGQRPHEDAVALHRQLLQQVGIPLFGRHRVRKADNDEPAVKALASVAVVARYLVAGKQQPGIGLEAEGILIFTLGGDIVLAGERLEDAVVVHAL